MNPGSDDQFAMDKVSLEVKDEAKLSGLWEEYMNMHKNIVDYRQDAKE